MDYDALPEASTSTASYAPSTKLRAAPQQVTLPANTPFDLDAYASQYTGRRKILRCLFIARSSPQLAADAYTLALRELQEQTFDVELYETVATEFNSRPESAGRRYPLDDVWAERTRRHVADQTDKLDVELKNYITNLIKESIRMGQRDIGNFAYKSGDLQSALRAYIKTRDYCATANQILEQIFTVIDVALDMQNYTLIRNFVVKAEATYDTIYQAPAAAAAAAASGGGASAQTKTVQMPGMLPPDQSAASQRKTEADDRRKSMMADRIAVVSGVGEMGSGNYTKAARKLLGVSSYAKDDDAGHFITAGDIALYGTLCGLASFERPALKRLVIDNSNLRPMLELEPHLKDIVACFYASNYKGALELLERYHPRHVLDIHLSHHIDVLLSQIRSRAIVQYFAPFSTTSLGRMATAFGWTETLMQAEVVRLIGTKDLKARVDSRNKTVHAYAPSQRTALFKHAHDVGRQQTSATRALLWRMNLIAADIVVKAPKQSKEGNAEAGPSEEGDSKGSPKKKDESDDTRPGGWTDLDASACCTVPSSLSGLTALPLIRAHIGRSSQQMTSAQSPVRLRPPLVSAALAPLLFRVVEDVVLSATKTDARTVMASLLSTAALVHLVRADLLRVKRADVPSNSSSLAAEDGSTFDFIDRSWQSYLYVLAAVGVAFTVLTLLCVYTPWQHLKSRSSRTALDNRKTYAQHARSPSSPIIISSATAAGADTLPPSLWLPALQGRPLSSHSIDLLPPNPAFAASSASNISSPPGSPGSSPTFMPYFDPPASPGLLAPYSSRGSMASTIESPRVRSAYLQRARGSEEQLSVGMAR